MSASIEWAVEVQNKHNPNLWHLKKVSCSLVQQHAEVYANLWRKQGRNVRLVRRVVTPWEIFGG